MSLSAKNLSCVAVCFVFVLSVMVGQMYMIAHYSTLINSRVMEEKQKIQVIFEFDRSAYDAYLFLMGQKKNEETENIWNAMAEEQVVADASLLDDDENTVKLMMISLAILAVEKKVKK
nr:MAG TPA: hypothetical protein [Caudoviricetes sp.]